MNWNKKNNDNNPWGSGGNNNPWGGGGSNGGYPRIGRHTTNGTCNVWLR